MKFSIFLFFILSSLIALSKDQQEPSDSSKEIASIHFPDGSCIKTKQYQITNDKIIIHSTNAPQPLSFSRQPCNIQYDREGTSVNSKTAMSSSENKYAILFLQEGSSIPVKIKNFEKGQWNFETFDQIAITVSPKQISSIIPIHFNKTTPGPAFITIAGEGNLQKNPIHIHGYSPIRSLYNFEIAAQDQEIEATFIISLMKKAPNQPQNSILMELKNNRISLFYINQQNQKNLIRPPIPCSNEKSRMSFCADSQSNSFYFILDNEIHHFSIPDFQFSLYTFTDITGSENMQLEQLNVYEWLGDSSTPFKWTLQKEESTSPMLDKKANNQFQFILNSNEKVMGQIETSDHKSVLVLNGQHEKQNLKWDQIHQIIFPTISQENPPVPKEDQLILTGGGILNGKISQIQNNKIEITPSFANSLLIPITEVRQISFNSSDSLGGKTK